jgi:hypothetical protein
MSLISQSLPGFWNGVSQQAATIRRSNQLELQENCLGTLVDGLQQRPNTKYLATLTSNATSGCFVHKINRDTSERYIVIFTGNPSEPIEVFAVSGTKYTVQYGTLNADMVYTADNNRKGYALPWLTTEKATNGSFGTDTAWTKGTGWTIGSGVANCDGSQVAVSNLHQNMSVTQDKIYRIRYKVKNRTAGAVSPIVGGTTGTSRNTNGYYEDVIVAGATAVSGVQADADFTGNIDDISVVELDTASNPAEQFKASTIADHTFIANTKAVVSEDDDANTDSLTGTVQTFADLPGSPSTGHVYKITGDGTTGFDDWWVKWTGSVWEETIKPTEKLGQLTDFTMPHRLVRTGTTTFTFAPCIWEDRNVGSNVTNPKPSFVGQKINNILFFKNRLGFLSDDNVVMSQTAEYYNFYGTTTLDVLDDAPIDVSATSNQIQVLRASAVFDKSIILFADQQQFDLGSGEATLTPNSIAITPTTKFNIDETCEPVTAGPNVYFIVPKTNYATMREYYVQADSLMSDAADVTGHVPEYLPMGHIQLEACNSLDILLAHSDADTDTLYLYKYFWAGDEKAQSSWSKWTFNGNILGMAIIQTTMYLVMKRDSVIYLETMELENEETGSLGFRIHLDRLTSPLTGAYSAANGWTTWTLPFNIASGLTMALINDDTGLELPGVTKVAANQVRVTGGDYTNDDYYWGEQYIAKARFTEWVLKNQRNEAVTDGRLQTRSLTLDFKETGYFRVEVTPKDRPDTLTQEMTGVYVGLAIIGQPSLITGAEKFMVLAKAAGTVVEIINDTYLPMAIQHGSWEGIYHPRARSI